MAGPLESQVIQRGSWQGTQAPPCRVNLSAQLPQTPGPAGQEVQPSEAHCSEGGRGRGRWTVIAN